MKNHDVSNKLKDLIHKIEIAIESTDSTTLLTVGELLFELQALASDRDPMRVIKILSLIVRLQKNTSGEKTEKKEC